MLNDGLNDGETGLGCAVFVYSGGGKLTNDDV